MILFPGDDQLEDSSRQSYGVYSVAGTERFGTVDASIINVSNLNASSITSGTINASVISVTNINASNISTGTLNADRIGATSITASKLNVETLSAIAANLGTITAGTISGSTLNGNTIRVGSGYGGGVYFYGSNGATFYDESNNEVGGIVASSNTLGVGAKRDIYLISNTSGAGGKTVLSNGNLDMNNLNIDACNNIYAYSFINRCEVAENIDPFEVMKTFEAEQSEKGKKKSWKKLDHNKLDRSIYKSTTREKSKYDVSKKKVINLGEEIQEGYDLGKLVELQRQAILQLKSEIEQLQNKKK